MQMPPSRTVGVADLGAAVAFLVSYRAMRAVLTPAGGEGPTAPTLEGVWDKAGLSWWK